MSTITNSNGVTTSDDTFMVTDTHFVYGGDQGLSMSSTTDRIVGGRRQRLEHLDLQRHLDALERCRDLQRLRYQQRLGHLG